MKRIVNFTFITFFLSFSVNAKDLPDKFFDFPNDYNNPILESELDETPEFSQFLEDVIYQNASLDINQHPFPVGGTWYAPVPQFRYDVSAKLKEYADTSYRYLNANKFEQRKIAKEYTKKVKTTFQMSSNNAFKDRSILIPIEINGHYDFDFDDMTKSFSLKNDDACNNQRLSRHHRGITSIYSFGKGGAQIVRTKKAGGINGPCKLVLPFGNDETNAEKVEEATHDRNIALFIHVKLSGNVLTHTFLGEALSVVALKESNHARDFSRQTESGKHSGTERWTEYHFITDFEFSETVDAASLLTDLTSYRPDSKLRPSELETLLKSSGLASGSIMKLDVPDGDYRDKKSHKFLRATPNENSFELVMFLDEEKSGMYGKYKLVNTSDSVLAILVAGAQNRMALPQLFELGSKSLVGIGYQNNWNTAYYYTNDTYSPDTWQKLLDNAGINVKDLKPVILNIPEIAAINGLADIASDNNQKGSKELPSREALVAKPTTSNEKLQSAVAVNSQRNPDYKQQCGEVSVEDEGGFFAGQDMRLSMPTSAPASYTIMRIKVFMSEEGMDIIDGENSLEFHARQYSNEAKTRYINSKINVNNGNLSMHFTTPKTVAASVGSMKEYFCKMVEFI
jgi:hypothetical protein